jgi:hypothetical protein
LNAQAVFTSLSLRLRRRIINEQPRTSRRDKRFYSYRNGSVGNRMTLEEQYAAQWKKDARSEGHRKGLPVNTHLGGSLRRPEAYAAILKSVQNGNTCIASIAENTGYGRQFVQDRLRYLNTHGKIVKVGNQWRIKE